jgi:hypothetical protein
MDKDSARDKERRDQAQFSEQMRAVKPGTTLARADPGAEARKSLPSLPLPHVWNPTRP